MQHVIFQAKEERMVEHDVLDLEGRRLKGSLVAAAQEIAGLENHKAQLRFSMEEHAQGDSELKMVREDIQRVTLELTERQQRVDKLHAKHDVLVSRNATPDGEVHTQAYYVIKAAQEREELQREGDILDGHVQTAEREVRGLEATLAKLNLVNRDMGKSFRRVDSSEAHAERATLREQLDWAYDLLKLKRTEAGARLEGLNQEEVQLQSALKPNTSPVVTEVGGMQEGLESQAEEQRQKQARADRRLERLQRDLTAKANVSTGAEALPAEKDIQLGALQDCNTQMLQDLAMFAAENPLSGVTEQLQAAVVHVPSNSLVSARSTGSLASSRSGSLSSLSTGRKIAPQRSMHLSTGSIGYCA
ncbi:TPA: Coiled-coil domain-containing protein 39 [Trebouxia sp. C0004]